MINSLEQIIPGTAAEFDFNHQQLNLSIPQIALYRDARGYVSPSRWDDGIPTLFTNYSFTGSDNRYRRGNRSQRQYLNMQNGANFGPRRLRNYSTWTRNDQTSSWNTISSYLQRDIKALKSQLLLGESATSGSIFPATPLLACNSLPTIICCQTASADLPQRYAVSQTVVQS